jgi:hypothetical protein
MSLPRLALSFASWSCVCLGILSATTSPGLAINHEPRSDQLEVLRTDPATVRTPQGQWLLTRDDLRWSDFRDAYGNGWRARWNELSRTPHRAFGGAIAPERLAAGVRPSGPGDKDAILRLSESFVRASGDLLAARWEDVRPAVVEFRAGHWIVILQQESQGIEVVGGRIDLRFSAAGELTLFGADIFPAPAAKALPTLGRDQILASARRGLPDLADGTPAPMLAEPELVLLPLLSGEPRDMGVRKAAPRDRVSPDDLRVRPAYRVRVKTDNPPGDWLTFVDAATGQILERTNQVRFIAVTGDVTGEIHPLTGLDPPVTVDFPDQQMFGGDVTGTVVSYNFESGAQGWVGDAPWARSGESVNGGSWAWSDSPGSNYADFLDISLTSPTINISGVSDPVLVYSTQLSLEDTWDFVYVEASADNGATWKTLRSITGYVGWHQEILDLAPVEGTSTLRVRFRLSTDTNTVDDGAWIDDVSIATLGSGITGTNGTYSLSTTGAGTTVSATLEGRFGRIINLAGSPAAESGAPVAGVFDVHWDGSNSSAGERDCYYSLNVSHARIKEIDPGFTALDYPLPVFAGLPNYCNAYWAGQQIVMGAGTPPTCNDLSTWGPVMYHEYGHGITQYTYAPFGGPSSEIHEALSDYYASTITGDPRVGTDIAGPGTIFRTIDNKLRDPEDRAGEGHIDGTILAGSLWDMRNLLGNVDLADSLFHFARYGRPYSFEDYYIELLLVDDDDANLGNGTPHETTIRSAFGFHGIGTGPEFEHVQVVVQDGGSGNGDGRLDPGEQADLLLTLHNYGGAETGVYAKISTSVPGVTISGDSVFVGNAGAGADVVAPSTFQVQIDGGVAVGTAIVFDLHIESDLGFNGDCFMLPVGYVPILLVDDDRTRTFDTYFQGSLDRLGWGYTRWQAGILGSPSAEEMAEYCAVIWLTGNDNSTTLSTSDQAELATYLGAGGRLFMTGEDVGRDLQLIGQPSDQAFYLNWLHAQVNVENEGGTSPPSVNGVGGDVVGNGMSFALNGGTGANNQNSVSSILPQGGAVAAFRYTNNRVAGLRYDGSHRLVYLGFGFEAVSTEANRDTLMSRAMSWLCPDEAQAPSVTVVDPNGGQSVTIGESYEIQWTATDDVAVLSVDILLSTDNGQTYAPLASGVPNSFAFDWTVGPTPSDSCLIRITAIDPSDNVGEDVSNTVFSITTPTDVAGGVPPRYALHGAVPNPFNPVTSLRFDVPRTSRVWLDIVSVNGRHVRSLLAGQYVPAGSTERTWDGRDDRGVGVAAGVYLVHMRADEFTATRKVQLVK